MKRRSLYLVAPRKHAWRWEELPSLGPGELLVETAPGAVSVGTERLGRGSARPVKIRLRYPAWLPF